MRSVVPYYLIMDINPEIALHLSDIQPHGQIVLPLLLAPWWQGICVTCPVSILVKLSN